MVGLLGYPPKTLPSTVYTVWSGGWSVGLPPKKPLPSALKSGPVVGLLGYPPKKTTVYSVNSVVRWLVCWATPQKPYRLQCIQTGPVVGLLGYPPKKNLPSTEYTVWSGGWSVGLPPTNPTAYSAVWSGGWVCGSVGLCVSPSVCSCVTSSRAEAYTESIHKTQLASAELALVSVSCCWFNRYLNTSPSAIKKKPTNPPNIIMLLCIQMTP